MTNPVMEAGLDSPMPERRGAKIFLISSAAAQFFALARYVLLARLLGPEQLGWAATLILTAQFFDSVTNTGGDRFLIQSPGGDREDVQRLLHLTSIARGIVTALLMAGFALPIARFFDEQDLAYPLMGLALAPFILGFMHLDLRRRQRHNDFAAEGWAVLASEIFAFIVTAAAAFILRDFTSALYGLVARAFALVVVSHITAERRFSIGMAPGYFRPLANFASPLMASGLLMFIGSQSDRVLVGDALGAAELGRYSAVLLLILYPSAMVQRYLTGVYMPLIAADRRSTAANESGKISPSESLTVETIALSMAMCAGFALVAPLATVILYGAAFKQSAFLIALIGLLQVYRFIRLWPTTEGLAAGRAAIPMVGNLVRIVGLAVALLVTRAGYGLDAVVTGFIMGELLALIVANRMANRALGRPAAFNSRRIAMFVGSSTFVLVCSWFAAEAHWLEFLVSLFFLGLISAWFILSEAVVLRGSIDALRRFWRAAR